MPAPRRDSALASRLIVLAVLVTGCAAFSGCGDGDPATGTVTGAAEADSVGGPSVIGMACQSDAACAALDDGDACNGRVRCDAALGRCRFDPGSVVVCDASLDTACRQQRCEPSSGSCVLTPVRDGTPCDDGDVCSVGDRCLKGQCAPGSESRCACKSDGDCAQSDDKCVGQRYCDTSLLPWTCRIKPNSALTCDTSGDDGVCQRTACDPKTGACAKQTAPDGVPCDDGEPCTTSDRCKDATCQGGPNVCGCQSDADCAAQEDGDACNGTLYCDLNAVDKAGKPAPKCVVNPATVVVCNKSKDTACAKSACDPKTGGCGLTPVPGGTACDDGDTCTTGDACFNGVCMAGTNTCICTSDAQCEAKEGDNNLCNGTLFCNQVNGKCQLNPATVVTCPASLSTACATNTCVNQYDGNKVATATTCQLKPTHEGQACDDGDVCTVGDVCAKGTCAGGKDVCLCKNDKDCIKQDDGDLCNGVLFCDKAVGKCKLNPASVVTCPTVDNTACRKRACTPKTGSCDWALSKDGSLCDDGDPCSASDYCVAGKCSPGAAICACQQDADCPDPDNDACTGVPYCDKSGAKPACKANPASKVVCSTKDDEACLKARCDPKTGSCGLAAVKAGTTCEDGDACSTATVCKAGVCGGGKQVSCDDGDPCTLDTCDAKAGCQHATKQCSDGNDCTLDGCDAATGKCKTGLRPKGSLCGGDGNGCTLNDSCDGKGTCVIGEPVTCLGKTPVCQHQVCKSKGAQDFACLTVARTDGVSCDAPGSCLLGATCQKGLCGAATAPQLFARIDGPKDGFLRYTGVVAMAMKAGAVAADVVVVGQRRSKASAPVSTNVGVVQRLSPTGAVRWSRELKGAQPHALTGAEAVVAASGGAVLVDGAVLVGGQAASGAVGAAADVDVAVQRLSDDGKLIWSKRFGGGAGRTERFGAMTVAPDGTLYVAASSQLGTEQRDLFLRITASGALMSSRLSKVHQRHRVISSLRGIGADDLLLTYGGAPDQLTPLWGVDRLQPTGATAWSLALVGAKPWKGPATAPRPGASQAFVMPGGETQVLNWVWQPDYATWQMTTVRLRADGTTRWIRRGREHVAPLAAARDEAGRIMVAAFDAVDATKPKVRLLAMDGQGNEQWSRTWASGGYDRPTAVAVLPTTATTQGGVVVVGHTRASATSAARQGVILRMDPWGHLSCSQPGLCAQKSAKACDDGKVCTADGCDAKVGCTHLTGVALRCDPKNGCSEEGTCVAGGCQSGANGKLYVKGYHYGDTGGRDRVYGLRASPKELRGLVPALNAPGQFQVMTFDHSLSVTTPLTYKGCGKVAWRDGDMLSAAEPAWTLWRGGSSAVGQAQICHATPGKSGSTGASSAPVVQSATVKGCFGCGLEPVSIHRTVDGGAWAVLQQTGERVGPRLVRYPASGAKQMTADVVFSGCGDGQCDAAESSKTCPSDCKNTAKSSCASRCGLGFDATKSCQCDLACVKNQDCCSDWVGVCLVGGLATAVAGAARPDASLAALSRIDKKGGAAARVDVVSVAGKVLWTRTLSLTGAVAPLAIDAGSQGELGVVGRHAPNVAVFSPYYAALTSAGKVRWATSLSPPQMAQGDAVHVLADGGLVFSGWRRQGSKERPALWRVDAAGKLMWSRTYDSPSPEVVLPRPGELALGGGNLFIGASSFQNSNVNIAMIRADLSGYASCREAGVCAGGLGSSCDDGKPCTADACDAKLGCVHTPIATAACAGK